MFRISQAVTRSGTKIYIDGQLTKEYAHFAEQYCSELLAAGKRLEVVLSDVSEVDEAGRNFLCRLASRGLSVHAKGVYMRYLLNHLRRMDRNHIPSPSPLSGQ
jgi:hypothetical protein